MKDIIYVNGCSFTTGIEIADYILPGYTKEFSVNEYSSFSFENFFGSDIINYNNWKQEMCAGYTPEDSALTYGGVTYRLEKEIRYTSILEKLVGIPVINAASPGCDNNSIYLRTCNDVYNLRKQGYNVKKIIFQFTGMSRFSYIKETADVTDELYGNYYLNFNKLDDEFMCRSINYANRNQPSYTTHEKHFVENEPTPALEIGMKLKSKWLNTFSKLNMYKDAVKGATGIEPIMVDSIFIEAELDRDRRGYSEHDFDFLNNPDVNTYIGRTMQTLFPQGMDSMAKMMDKNKASLTPGLHFNKEVHELFAEHLARKYFNE